MSLRLVVFLLLLLPCWPQQHPVPEAERIRQLIANYVAAVDAADVKLAAQVWDNSPEVSFIHPLGHAHGWEEVRVFFTDIIGGLFSDRKLTPRDIKVAIPRGPNSLGTSRPRRRKTGRRYKTTVVKPRFIARRARGGSWCMSTIPLCRQPSEIRDRWTYRRGFGLITLYLFAAFFLFLRLKMYLDDYQYFGNADTTSPNFKIGFIAGFGSWVLWGLSANAVSEPLEAYFLLGIAITVSTFWILVDGLWRGASRAQYFWIGSNAAFVALLWGAYRRNRPDGDFVTATIFGFALLLLAVDFTFSKSFPELKRTPGN